MKKIICLLTAMSCVFILKAQSLNTKDFEGYEAVERYYQGSLAIAKALNTQGQERNLYFEDAIELLNQQPGTDGNGTFYKKLDATIKSGSDVETANDSIKFDYSFARSCYTENKYIENQSLRETSTANGLCRVKNMAVKPGGTIILEDIQKGNSLALIVTNIANSLSLEVKGEEIHKAQKYENGLVEFCHWNEPEENDVEYVIKNLTDEIVPFVIICN